jgi:SOS-response transcriptional repressor LexA
MKSAFKDRLNDALNYKNMKASELSRLSKVNEGAISQYRKGRYKAKQDTIEKLANALNVSIPWLMGADVPMQPLNLVSPNITDDVVTFPVLGCIAAGYEEIAVEDWNGAVVEVPAAYLKGRDKKDFFVLEVRGNSMYPLYQEKDIVLILKQNYIDHNGDVGAVIYDGECATLKRIDVSDDMVRLSPINPEYLPKELRGADLEMYHILGVPKMLIREIS